eukprot:15470987-Alexandrium_andersonii.AAC.1
MSAGFLSPGNFIRAKSPERTRSCTGADTLLHPQLADRQVSDAPYARAPADADGRATVCADLKGCRKSQILGDG